MKKILSKALKKFLRLAQEELPEEYDDWLREQVSDFGREEDKETEDWLRQELGDLKEPEGAPVEGTPQIATEDMLREQLEELQEPFSVGLIIEETKKDPFYFTNPDIPRDMLNEALPEIVKIWQDLVEKEPWMFEQLPNILAFSVQEPSTKAAKNTNLIKEGDTPFKGHPILNETSGARLAHATYKQLINEAVMTLNDIGINASAEQLAANPEMIMGIGGQLFMDVMQQEAAIQPFLEDLAIKTVAEAYGIPEETIREMTAEIKLKGMGEMGEVGDDQQENEEEIEEPEGEMLDFIERRKTHNALIQGTALNHMSKAIALAEAAIEQQVPGLYKKQKAVSDLMVLTHYLIDLGAIAGAPRQGQEDVQWDEEGNQKISASASIFPILVQELSKAVAETNYSHGLGMEGELTPYQQQQFYKYADNEMHEPYYFMMGPALADTVNRTLAKPEIIDDIGEGESIGEDLAYARALLSMIPAKELHEILVGITGDSDDAKAVALRKLKKELLEAEQRSQM